MLHERTNYQNGFPLNIKIAKVIKYPLHYHQEVEFICVLKGEINLKIVSSNYILRKGDIFTINANEIHGLTTDNEDNAIAIIQVSNQFFTQYFPTLPKACFMTYGNPDKDTRIYKLQKMLLPLILDFAKKSFDYKNTCVYQMVNLIRYMNANFNLFAFEGKDIVNFKSNDPVILSRISHIVNHIYENHSEKITLEELSNREHLSTFYLSHLIHDYIGISFQEFLCFARVEMSEIPLLQTNKKISTISKDIGFSSTTYYEKFFIKWFGHSPQEHREIFESHILDENNPPKLDIIPENSSVNIIKEFFISINGQEKSAHIINNLQQNIDIIPNSTPIANINPVVDVAITHEDYHVLGDRLFGILYELNTTNIILSTYPHDNKITTELITNKLNFSGYNVTYTVNNRDHLSPASWCDSIVSPIKIFQKCFTSQNNLHCILRDQGDSCNILNGGPGCLTSCNIQKPSFHAYRLLRHISGKLLCCDKHYYVIKNNLRSSDSYVIVILNYNDKMQSLTKNTISTHETNDIINNFMDELNVNFNIPVSSGMYSITKVLLSNANSIFTYMSQLGFPSAPDLSKDEIGLLNTQPQTQINIECIKDNLHVSSTINGAGIEVILISKISPRL